MSASSGRMWNSCFPSSGTELAPACEALAGGTPAPCSAPAFHGRAPTGTEREVLVRGSGAAGIAESRQPACRRRPNSGGFAGLKRVFLR